MVSSMPGDWYWLGEMRGLLFSQLQWNLAKSRRITEHGQAAGDQRSRASSSDKSSPVSKVGVCWAAFANTTNTHTQSQRKRKKRGQDDCILMPRDEAGGGGPLGGSAV